jgi:hypothetical protein
LHRATFFCSLLEKYLQLFAKTHRDEGRFSLAIERDFIFSLFFL